MREVLFTLPFVNYLVPSFGAVLFVTFVACTWWAVRRGSRVGMQPERMQDMTIWIFLAGIIGARILYMIQYSEQFPDTSIGGLLLAFVSIWKGGIIFYGSALGGAIGYGLFYWFVLRRMKINGWQIADAVAPVVALGLAIGRIGCYLNGCCWGQVTCEETCPVPLGAAHFPLLPAHSRDQLVGREAVQTSTGFAIATGSRGFGAADDPRSVVAAVEPGSPAAAAGVRTGDRIVRVNGQPNAIVMELFGTTENVAAGLDVLKSAGAAVVPADASRDSNGQPPGSAAFETVQDYEKGRLALIEKGMGGLTPTTRDRLWELVHDWPRGKPEIELVVLRDGKEIELPPFTPRTVGLYPTQLYEVVSMVLLIGLLLAWYPFRRHDGELFVLLMLGYAVHRFIDESLRIEPNIGLGLTLSQWGSVAIFVAGLGIEAYLWRTMPSRWKTAPV